MNLETHLKQSKLSIEEYASARGLSHMTIREALKGKFTEKTAQTIYEMSNKQVKLQPKKFIYK